MAWVKGLHIISIVFWSASLIYLPILMAGHNPRLSNPAYLRLHGMVRNVYVWLASPFAILAIVSGTALIPLRDVTAPWFALKLLFVAALAIIHARCGSILAKQSHDAERANALVRAMRIALPILLFPCVLWLVLAKPRLDYSPEPPELPDLPVLELGRQPPKAALALDAPYDSSGFRLRSKGNMTTAAASMGLRPLLRRPVLRTPAFHPANPLPTPRAGPAPTNPHPTDTGRQPDRTGA